jgi:hypothetical protein
MSVEKSKKRRAKSWSRKGLFSILYSKYMQLRGGYLKSLKHMGATMTADRTLPTKR